MTIETYGEFVAEGEKVVKKFEQAMEVQAAKTVTELDSSWSSLEQLELQIEIQERLAGYIGTKAGLVLFNSALKSARSLNLADTQKGLEATKTKLNEEGVRTSLASAGQTRQWWSLMDELTLMHQFICKVRQGSERTTYRNGAKGDGTK